VQSQLLAIWQHPGSSRDACKICRGAPDVAIALGRLSRAKGAYAVFTEKSLHLTRRVIWWLGVQQPRAGKLPLCSLTKTRTSGSNLGGIPSKKLVPKTDFQIPPKYIASKYSDPMPLY
jgi:hypothetical protein